MKIEMVCKNYNAGEKLKDLIEKKIAKLDKYFEEEAKCKIYLKKENRDCKMEAELNYKGVVIRAQAYAENFYDAVDLVIPKLEKQVCKHHSKLGKQIRQTALKDVPFTADELRPAVIVKTKKFKLEALTTDEAIEQFEMLGHSFYVYLDKASEQIKVLYLRDDGELGLIEPELEG